MARKKVPVNNKPKGRRKPGKQSSQSTLGQFLRFLMRTPMRQLIMTVIIVVLFWVFRDSLSDFFETLRELFGWGLLFIFAAIVGIITMIWRRTFGSFIRNWYRWLGGIAFVLAVWGILAFFAGNTQMPKGLGGSFGNFRKDSCAKIRLSFKYFYSSQKNYADNYEGNNHPEEFSTPGDKSQVAR